MHESALRHLVSPGTLASLELSPPASPGSDVREGELRAGDRTYPIEQGIPRFVPAEVAADQTVRSFAQKWDKHRYYRQHTREFYSGWYLARYGLEDEAGLRELVEGKLVLDAGTGSGRDATWFAESGAALVYGVDTAWSALTQTGQEVNRDNLALVQADVNQLPFPDGFFDVISCDQVIHHTPDPPRAFENLARKLKVGGQVCAYVYRKKAVLRELSDDIVRDRIKDLPIDEALAVCEGITRLGKAFADLKASVEVPEDIPALGIAKGRYDVQRFLHWNVLKCFWNDNFDFFTNNIVNFDWYHPVHCFRYQPAEFRAWFDQGWEILAWDEQEAGISCRARKVT